MSVAVAISLPAQAGGAEETVEDLLGVVQTWMQYAGTIAFAISGALLAMSKRMDLAGIVVLGAIVSVGGGTLRDLLVQQEVFWIEDPTFVLVGAGTSNTNHDRLYFSTFAYVLLCALRRLGLGQRAWKSIKQEPFAAVVLDDPLLDEADDHIVRHQSAGVHGRLRLLAEIRPGCHRLPQKVSGGYLGDIELFDQFLRLSAFAGPWCAKKNYSHFSLRLESRLPERLGPELVRLSGVGETVKRHDHDPAYALS
mgnify:CR=1 FL=1